MSKTTLTDRQLSKTLAMLRHKGATVESYQRLLASGILAHVFDPQIDIKAARRALGLNLLDTVDILDFPGNSEFRACDRFTQEGLNIVAFRGPWEECFGGMLVPMNLNLDGRKIEVSEPVRAIKSHQIVQEIGEDCCETDLGVFAWMIHSKHVSSIARTIFFIRDVNGVRQHVDVFWSATGFGGFVITVGANNFGVYQSADKVVTYHMHTSGMPGAAQ